MGDTASSSDTAQVPPPIASPVDGGWRCNRRPHPATAPLESCRRRGHGLVSLTHPKATLDEWPRVAVWRADG
jgi:hypothetical protein